MNPLAPLQRMVFALFLYIFKLVSYAGRRLLFVGKGIPVEDKMQDFAEVFRRTIIFFLFNMLALLVFTVLPQGKDIILIIIEDLSRFRIWSLVSLLGGLTAWCIISEFGARYKIYVTDNSGLSLTDERVNYRKEVQKFVSTVYLLLPVMIVMISLIIVSFGNIKVWQTSEIWPFVIVLLLLLVLFALLSRFYLDAIFIEKKRKKGVWYKVKEIELRWAQKLYGIYNDYVLMVRRETNFRDADSLSCEPDPKDPEKRQPPPTMDVYYSYKRFIDLLEKMPDKDADEDKGENPTIEEFPRKYLTCDELPPLAFKEVEFKRKNQKVEYNRKRDGKTKEEIACMTECEKAQYEADLKKEPEFILTDSKDGYYRWIFKSTPSFYKTLHLQIHVIFISSLVFMLLVSTGFFISYHAIGSPALVCLAFASWLGIYIGFLYIDSRFRRKLHFSIRYLLVLWFFAVSYINHDHPVRSNGDAGFSKERFTLHDHFISWLATRDASYIPALLPGTGPSIPGSQPAAGDTTRNAIRPVYFITAEGGGMRTAAFSSLFLARLQDENSNFKDNIYGFSTVSGGSVGVGLFNAIAYLEPNGDTSNKHYYHSVTEKFFSQDQLSPVIAKLFYADIINNFWPWHIENFDRAIALEKAWEHCYAEVFGRSRYKNVFSTNYLSMYNSALAGAGSAPAWFINTTEVESGLQCYISNVRANDFILARERDLLLEKIRYGINYSTAINFSSRFPIFSPSAALYQNDDQTFHYVDGGYVENTGAKTMLEMIQSLAATMDTNRIIPYVIALKFSDEDSTRFGQTGFLNEFSSITTGIYKTRYGSSITNMALLEKQVKRMGGKVIEVPLKATAEEVPMSWVFSKSSLRKLNEAIDENLKDREIGEVIESLKKRR